MLDRLFVRLVLGPFLAVLAPLALSVPLAPGDIASPLPGSLAAGETQWGGLVDQAAAQPPRAGIPMGADPVAAGDDFYHRATMTSEPDVYPLPIRRDRSLPGGETVEFGWDASGQTKAAPSNADFGDIDAAAYRPRASNAGDLSPALLEEGIATLAGFGSTEPRRSPWLILGFGLLLLLAWRLQRHFGHGP